MTQVLWITDPHLDFVKGDGAHTFGVYLKAEYPDAKAVVVTGDIAEFGTFSKMIERFAQAIGMPVYFTLGNHDFYGGSIAAGKKKAAAVSNGAHYLPSSGTIAFGGTALIGHDGWYDGRNGLGAASRFLLRDFDAIKELRDEFVPNARRLGDMMSFYGALPAETRKDILKGVIKVSSDFADAEAARAKKHLQSVIAKGFKKVIFATHVPPFAEAAWHLGKPSDEDALPWFSSKVMGESLLEVAVTATDVDILVLCGHSHSPGEYQAAPNMRVVTGKAVYKSPDVAAVFDWS